MKEAFKTEFTNLVDMKSYVGKMLGVSNWFTITQEDINTFGRITGDEQWIHTKPDLAAKYSPYGTPIAHGFMVLSLASKFCEECYAVMDATMGVNYGLDRVRFINATKVGSEIRGRVELIEYNEIPNGAKFKVLVTGELKGEEKPAYVAEFIAQIYANAEQRKAFDALMAQESQK